MNPSQTQAKADGRKSRCGFVFQGLAGARGCVRCSTTVITRVQQHSHKPADGKISFAFRRQIAKPELPLGLVHTGGDARSEKRSKIGGENPIKSKFCPHCTHQAMHDATSTKMGPGSIYSRRASSVDEALYTRTEKRIPYFHLSGFFYSK